MKPRWNAIISAGLATAILFGGYCITRPGGVVAGPVGPVLNAVGAAGHDETLIDDAWTVAVADAKTATTSPYNPSTAEADANPSTSLALKPGWQPSYTGVVVRVRYPNGGSLSTSAVVYVWGLKTDTWCALADAYGDRAITLASATDDATDGTYAWTAPSATVDALGCSDVVVTVQTAAVCAAGAARVEISRY